MIWRNKSKNINQELRQMQESSINAKINSKCNTGAGGVIMTDSVVKKYVSHSYDKLEE